MDYKHIPFFPIKVTHPSLNCEYDHIAAYLDCSADASI